MKNIQELMNFCKLIVGYVQDFYYSTVSMVIKIHENIRLYTIGLFLFIILIGIDHNIKAYIV